MDMVIGILILLVLGLIVGALAKFLMPGDDPGGIVVTSILGILGAIVGGWIASTLEIGGITGLNWRSLVTALGGALVLLLAYRAFRLLTRGSSRPSYATGGSSSATALRAFSSNAEDAFSTTNLAEIAKGSITPEVVQKLSDRLGESAGDTRRALEAMIPTVLAGAANLASTTVGANQLFDLAKEAPQGGVDRLLGGGDLETLSSMSRGFLGTVFGDKLGGLLNWFARFAGVKESSASSLMSVASGVVMSLLGKTIHQKGLNASGFGRLLASQSGWLSRLLPAGIGDVPGMRTLADLGDRATETTRAADDAGKRVGATAREGYRETVGVGAAREETPWLAALLPLLLLALPLLAFTYMMRGTAAKLIKQAENVQVNVPQVQVPHVKVPEVQPSEIPTPATPTSLVQVPHVKVPEVQPSEIPTPATPPPLVATTYVEKLLEIKLPDGKSLNLPESSFLNGVYKYLKDDATAAPGRTFVFDGLDFDAATIKVRPETETAVTHLTTLLEAFPNVTLRIDAHTDRSADPVADKRLSLERAEALKSMLVKAGVPAYRIKTSGLGSERPVASNDTPEGRAKNRRIELSLDQVKAPRVQLPDVKVPEVQSSEIPTPATPPSLAGTTYVEKLLEIKLPDGKSLNLPESSFLNEVYNYLKDATATRGRTFVFDGLDFDAATIKVRPETETAVTHLTTLLGAFPNVTLRIDAHTDRSANPVADKWLSLDRAEALKSLLVKAGVPADRVKTSGFGSERPVASNDTPEGRAKNRRIELSLDKL